METFWLFNLTRLLIFSICRLYFRIEFEGADRVPSSGAMILAPNHVSYLDPFWVSLPIRRPLRYMTWDKMTRLPLLGPLIQAYGAFPVKIDKGDRGALRVSLSQLQEGGGLVVFPEGARTRTGRIRPFKPGVVRLALEARVPIVPVTIIGGYRAFSPHHLFPRPCKVRVIYHDPIHLDDSMTKDQMHREARRLHDIVALDLPDSESQPIEQANSSRAM
ncbi:MAG: lysophospholipid acyltransferase family protein [Blastocatellia bacterium]